MSEDIPEHAGVVVFGPSDAALGFGVMARAGVDVKRLEPTAVVAFNQADVGEYLRNEAALI